MPWRLHEGRELTHSSIAAAPTRLMRSFSLSERTGNQEPSPQECTLQIDQTVSLCLKPKW
jgi:hypothetical protein